MGFLNAKLISKFLTSRTGCVPALHEIAILFHTNSSFIILTWPPYLSPESSQWLGWGGREGRKGRAFSKLLLSPAKLRTCLTYLCLRSPPPPPPPLFLELILTSG